MARRLQAGRAAPGGDHHVEAMARERLGQHVPPGLHAEALGLQQRPGARQQEYMTKGGFHSALRTCMAALEARAIQ